LVGGGDGNKGPKEKIKKKLFLPNTEDQKKTEGSKKRETSVGGGKGEFQRTATKKIDWVNGLLYGNRHVSRGGGGGLSPLG